MLYCFYKKDKNVFYYILLNNILSKQISLLFSIKISKDTRILIILVGYYALITDFIKYYQSTNARALKFSTEKKKSS